MNGTSIFGMSCQIKISNQIISVFRGLTSSNFSTKCDVPPWISSSNFIPDWDYLIPSDMDGMNDFLIHITCNDE